MKIIPAILPRNFGEIEEKIELIKDHSDIVQIDICDGKFVSTITWPYWKSDEGPDTDFEALLKEKRGMPEWEKIDYEFDLMIANPTAEDAQKWLSVGGKKIVLHVESSGDLMPALKVLDGLVEIGIAINNAGNVEDLKRYEDKFQFIQVMGIRGIGFQGQIFQTSTIDKVKEIKAIFPHMKIQVDGGVTLENAVFLKHAGVDRLVTGSALFGSENIVDTFEQFKSI